MCNDDIPKQFAILLSFCRRRMTRIRSAKSIFRIKVDNISKLDYFKKVIRVTKLRFLVDCDLNEIPMQVTVCGWFKRDTANL